MFEVIVTRSMIYPLSYRELKVSERRRGEALDMKKGLKRAIGVSVMDWNRNRDI